MLNEKEKRRYLKQTSHGEYRVGIEVRVVAGKKKNCFIFLLLLVKYNRRHQELNNQRTTRFFNDHFVPEQNFLVSILCFSKLDPRPSDDDS